MLMRLKPIRGQFINHKENGKVQIVETIADKVKVILPNGRLDIVGKAYLDLPIIDTKDYEKF